MKQEIELNNFDLIKAIAYSHYRNKFLWGLSIVAGLLTEGIGYVGLWAMGWPLSGIVSVTVDMLVFIFILNTISLICTVLALLLNPKWRKGRIGFHELEIAENSIVESTKYNKSEILWPAINGVVIKKNYAYIVHQGADVFIIPKRCFLAEEAWVKFTDILVKNWSAGKNA
jgi:hypothetical protein